MKKITSALLAVIMLISLFSAVVLPATAETTYPSVTTIATDTSVLDLSVNSLEELNYVANNNSKFTVDHTIHLTQDIALTADSAAQTKMRGFKGSIDGGGHTISGISFTGAVGTNNNNGWLGTYGGTSIKNITFDDCHATNLGWQGALLMFSFTANSLTLENVTAKNCSVATAGQNGLSILVGIQDYNYNTNKQASELVLTNIHIEGCTMDCKEKSGNSGFVVGRARNGITRATNISVINNTVKATKLLGGAGIVFGEVTNHTTLQNCVAINNDAVYPRVVIAGMFKDCDEDTSKGLLDMDNVIVAGNGVVASVVYRGKENGVHKIANTYSDVPVISGTAASTESSVSANTSLTTTELLHGRAAYELNNAGVSQKWVINPETGCPDFYAEGDSLPYQVTFTATGTDSSGNAVSSTEHYYTNADGKLVGDVSEVFKYANWNGITADSVKQTIYTQNTSYTGTLRTVYKIMDQNLWIGASEDQKAYMVERILDLAKPDIILAQECNEAWKSYLETGKVGYTGAGRTVIAEGDAYTMYYEPRSESDTECPPIIYKNTIFNVVDSGRFWISETPDVESLGWDGACYRTCMWMVLEDKTTHENLVVASFHLDHKGAVAKVRGAQLVAKRLKELQERYPGSTLVTAADINSNTTEQPYAAFTAELGDARKVASESTEDTFTHSGTTESTTEAELHASGTIIDFIFVDTNTAKVLSFDVLDDTFSESSMTGFLEMTTTYYRPSDHNGLLATIVSASDVVASKCDHTWTVTSHNNGTHTRTCTGCGSTSTHDCSYRYTYVDGVTHTATCGGDEGWGCGYTFSENCVYYNIRYVEPTCTEDGYTVCACEGCGNIYNKTDEDTAGCVWTNYTSVDATNHSAVCKNDDTHTKTEAHTFTSEVKAPTCTEKGYTTHTCSLCGYHYDDTETAVIPHSYEDTVTAPTCTAKGYTTHVCTVCKHTYTDTETAVIPHSYEDTVTAPTCTAQGYTTHTCSACGDTYTDAYTEMLPHTYVWDSANKQYACSCGAVHSGVDVNNDGADNTADVVLVCRYIVGYTDPGVVKAAMDYNKDGRISIMDALLMLRSIMN